MNAAAFFTGEICLLKLIILAFDKPDIAERKPKREPEIVFTEQHGAVTPLTKFKSSVYDITLVDLLVSKTFNW